nr:integrase, catalytic region, zinc finger, CCHC-type, peptidase aspartic, catalytic [Tanacetum cinerariifolium]
MSTQQDIYAAGSESRPPMLNKENYVPWSSRLLRYAKSRPNGKLIHNSFLNGPYVRKIIPEPGDANREITITETFHLQTDDELSDKELKQIEADDQAIQTILLGLPEDIYATERFTSNEGESIESYYHRFLKLMNDLKRNKHFPEKIATDYTQLYDFRKYNQNEVDELKAERLAKTQDPLALMANSNNHYAFLAPHQDQSSFNQNYLQQPMPNPEDITDLTTAMNMALALMAKAFKLNYSTPTNNNQRISSNPRNRQIAQPGMNMSQDRQMQMVRGNGGNQFRQYAGQNAGNLAGYNDVIGNQNHIGNGNLVAARAEGNAAGQNGNQIRCYNCRGVEEYDLMAAAADLDEIKEVNANCILMANLQQASTSEEQYIELLEPIPESHQVPQNDNDVISEDTSVEQAKFVGDFKSLADASLAKHKALELEIERLLKAVENEYAKLWNDWYKKCDECKYDKISYDKAYKDMQQKIERFQAQLGDLKGKSKDTSCVLDTRNPLSQKLENKNVELESRVLNYARENAHLKAIYKNLFDSISVSRTQTKKIITSLQNELQSTIYKNAKLRTQLFKKVSDQKDNTQDTSENTKFTKQPIVENLPKVGETNALSKPVTSNSVSTPQESKGVNNDKVIAPGMFRINPFKTSREEKHVPNTVSASNRKKPITVSQPPVITKKDVNSDLNGLSSTLVDNTKTRRPQPKSNTKHDRVPSASKSSQSKNKEAEVEEHHRNLLLSKNNQHISPACNNIQIDSQDVISKVVCAMCRIVDSSESVSQSNYVNGDNACTSNSLEPKIKRLPKSTSLLDRVYFVEGLGHNLFLVAQFCDSDLEVVYRRNACFVRNLEGVDLLKGDRSTNLYTINLNEMASASPICLMARASSTKSWLWH